MTPTMGGMEPHATSALTLDTLPDCCRVWIFAANRPFTDEERGGLGMLMEKIFGKWDMKQPGMRGCHAFVEDRFLVVGAEEHREMLDGCSVDAMMSFVMRLERESGLRLVDRMMVHFRGADGAARSVSRLEFSKLVKSGEVTGDTVVFDTTVCKAEDWNAGRFTAPMRDTWLAEAFPTG